MSLTSLLNRDCTIISRSLSATRDEFGNDLHHETATATVCELQQQQRAEPAAAGELSITTWLLVLPAGTVVGTADSVVVDGREYELIGEPWAARNPRTQAESHIEATVRRTAGEGPGS